MGEIQKRPFQLSFNASLRVDFQSSRVTSDGGLILVHELDEQLGFGEIAAECLIDTRARNAKLPIVDLLRQSVCSRLTGYEDANDAERPAQDPSFRPAFGAIPATICRCGITSLSGYWGTSEQIAHDS